MYISSDESIPATFNRHFQLDGYRFDIHISRPSPRNDWSLIVFDHQGRRYSWAQTFRTEAAACDVALNTLEMLGALRFMQQDQVIHALPPVPA